MSNVLFEAFRNAMRTTSRKEAKDRFIDEMRSDPVFLDLLAEDYFERLSKTWQTVGTDNNYALVARRAESRQRTARVYTAMKSKLRQIVLMDLTLPNGKLLRDATGAACSRAGGFFTEVSRHLHPNQVVDKHLTETDLRNIQSRFQQKEVA